MWLRKGINVASELTDNLTFDGLAFDDDALMAAFDDYSKGDHRQSSVSVSVE
jgi:hypothetical protein